MLLLLIPALLWIVSCQLLMRADGQKGFDRFFLHFVLQGLEVVAALLLLNYFQVPVANRIAIGIVAAHTLLIFLMAVGSYLGSRLRSKVGTGRTA